MNAEKMKNYFEGASCSTMNEQFFLYTKALEEYCQHFYTLCYYADEIGAGVLLQEDDQNKAAETIEAMSTACEYLCRYKSSLLKKKLDEVEPAEFFNKELGEEFCHDGKKAVLAEGKLLNSENISEEKIKKIRSKVTPSLLEQYEYTCYINTVQSRNKEV